MIEQAKGMIAERQHIPVDEAFDRLRRHARNHNLRLADVARDTVDGTIDPQPSSPRASEAPGRWPHRGSVNKHIIQSGRDNCATACAPCVTRLPGVVPIGRVVSSVACGQSAQAAG